MKKKTIEKIPYLKLPSVICKKDVKYVGVTAVKVSKRRIRCHKRYSRVIRTAD